MSTSKPSIQRIGKFVIGASIGQNRCQSKYSREAGRVKWRNEFLLPKAVTGVIRLWWQKSLVFLILSALTYLLTLSQPAPWHKAMSVNLQLGSFFCPRCLCPFINTRNPWIIFEITHLHCHSKPMLGHLRLCLRTVHLSRKMEAFSLSFHKKTYKKNTKTFL